ncbi:MAG TPA: hypothetical protein VHM29_05970 [Acidimicrobiia bacterium]|jgi:hypothetical protein|nr:hypothetical protein [Acidimicrobiia bacterium]
MSRFDQGRWHRILVWTGAAIAWSSALIAGSFPPGFGGTADHPESGVSETIDAKQAMPNLPDQGLIVIRQGTGQTSQPAVQLSQPPAPAPAPEMTSSGS